MKYLIDRPGKHEIKLSLSKEGEKLEWLGVVCAREAGEYELDLVMTHLVPDTFGRVEIRGVAENGARVTVRGLVRIEKQAQNSDSFLSMKVLLLDKKSSAVAEPELEILANQVKVSHSASVGKIDKEQLFYLASRGIDETQGKKIIVRGFLGEVTQCHSDAKEKVTQPCLSTGRYRGDTVKLKVMNKEIQRKIDEFVNVKREIVNIVNEWPEGSKMTVLFDKWSLKDVVAHLSNWMIHEIDCLIKLKQGKEPYWEPNVEVFNLKGISERKSHDWDKVHVEFASLGDGLEEIYQTMPNELWDVPIWNGRSETAERFLQENIDHWEGHLSEIQKVTQCHSDTGEVTQCHSDTRQQ